MIESLPPAEELVPRHRVVEEVRLSHQPTPASPRDAQLAAEPRYLAALEAERASWWNSENFDSWKNLYVGEYGRGFYILGALAEYVSGFDPAGLRVLDVGCGDAGAVIAFAERGARCAGLETDERSLARGRLRAEEHGVEVDLRPGVAERLPWADGSFDLVLLDNVLEHVTDREATLREIRRVLRPRGILYLVTPKPFALHSLWKDPHYGLAGLVLMPRRMQVWYFERVRGGGAGNYGVGVIPTRRGVRRLLLGAGFTPITSPRELWIRYLRARIARPEEVRPGPKQRIARLVSSLEWPFRASVARWFWDISLGSNFFIAVRGD